MSNCWLDSRIELALRSNRFAIEITDSNDGNVHRNWWRCSCWCWISITKTGPQLVLIVHRNKRMVDVFKMLILILGWWCSCKQTSRLMIHVCFSMCCCVILEVPSDIPLLEIYILLLFLCIVTFLLEYLSYHVYTVHYYTGIQYFMMTMIWSSDPSVTLLSLTFPRFFRVPGTRDSAPTWGQVRQPFCIPNITNWKLGDVGYGYCDFQSNWWSRSNRWKSSIECGCGDMLICCDIMWYSAMWN